MLFFCLRRIGCFALWTRASQENWWLYNLCEMSNMVLASIIGLLPPWMHMTLTRNFWTCSFVNLLLLSCTNHGLRSSRQIGHSASSVAILCQHSLHKNAYICLVCQKAADLQLLVEPSFHSTPGILRAFYPRVPYTSLDFRQSKTLKQSPSFSSCQLELFSLSVS